MPQPISENQWVLTARRQISELSAVEGKKPLLTIAKSVRNKVELSMRPRQPGNRITLPFEWCERQWGDCYVRIRNVYAYAAKGHTLVEAAELAQAKAPSKNRNWAAYAKDFKHWKMTADSGIKLTTWEHSYEPVIQMAIGLLTAKKAPITAQALVLACVSEFRTGSRMRKIRVRSLVSFLSYCVDQHHLPDAWAPPKNLKPLIGAEKPSEAVRQKADAFAHDQQIIDLIESLPTEVGTQRDREAARQWADATRLLAELGLRPIELLHLKVKTEEISGEAYWWCTYEKKGGNGATKARRIYPLPLVGADGEVQQWNLMARWRAGLIKLPPLESGNGAGECWKTYFVRRPAWVSLKELMLSQEDKRLTAYSFRHSYSVRGTRRGIDSGSMATSMGHSIQTHCQHYPWAEKSSTAEAFAKATAQMVAT
uniref:site-specific integrase n=1 Tax=Cyanobium sp. TaxID=2164130 RepID=UPI0040481050